MRNQVIYLVVGEMAFISSGIEEFRYVVKSQAEFLFGVVLLEKDALLICSGYFGGSAEIKTERC